MKKVFLVFSVLVLSLVLVACGPSEATATGYGITHQDYVGVVQVTVNKEGIITDASIEEYYLVYTIGAVENPSDNATDIVTGLSHGNEVSYAKYFSVNGMLFTGQSSTTGLPEYKNADEIDLLDWVAVEANAKAYVEGTQAGTVFCADASGAKHATYAVTEGDQWTKSASGYGGDRWDWLGQMTEVELALIGTSLDDGYSQNSDNKWVVGDAVTGATLTDFPQYYEVAHRAYTNALQLLVGVE